MRITSVAINNHKGAFEIRVRNRTLTFPFARAEPRPTLHAPVVHVAVDPELAYQGFVYQLASGVQGDVLLDQVLEYNRDPGYERKRLLYLLTIEAQKRLAKSPLSKREIIRRLRTSPSQFYRILDQANYRKSIDQVIALLNVLECDVDVVVRRRRTA